MGKLFGTDGIRGIANENLTAGLAYRVGQAAAIVLGESGEGKPLVLIGKDTRVSSDMLEAAMCAGLSSCGANVLLLGVIPTPGVAYLTSQNRASAGVVISASHNPYEYNGIKIFDREGYKLADALEERIEELVLGGGELPLCPVEEIGSVNYGRSESDFYIRYIASTVRGGLENLRVLVDCANGAASATARRLFSKFSLDATFINDKPDGKNINNGCGSTHLAGLSEKVVRGSYDVGIAFDGDADRCLVVDEHGCEVDGDKIMAICARAMLEEGDLAGETVVATVMSNMGFHKYLESRGMKVVCAAVGDRNVLEEMRRGGFVLGGEQSGHIIFFDHMTTGDGQLAALHFLSILCKWGGPVSAMTAEIPSFPQTLLNVAAPLDNSARRALCASEAIAAAVADWEKKLGSDGRILVRPSGTEALIRVMVEADKETTANEIASSIANIIENLQK